MCFRWRDGCQGVKHLNICIFPKRHGCKIDFDCLIHVDKRARKRETEAEREKKTNYLLLHPISEAFCFLIFRIGRITEFWEFESKFAQPFPTINCIWLSSGSSHFSWEHEPKKIDFNWKPEWYVFSTISLNGNLHWQCLNDSKVSESIPLFSIASSNDAPIWIRKFHSTEEFFKRIIYR